MLLSLIVISFILSLFLSGRLCCSSRLRVLDHPNERSLHHSPVPRTGGVGVCGVVLATGATAALLLNPQPPESVLWIVAGSALVAGISVFEDFSGVPAGYRFLAHSAAAVLLLPGGYQIKLLEMPGLALAVPAYLAAPLTVVFVVWMVNLYNFMDGMDGFAAGMAVIGFAAFAVLGLGKGEPFFVALSLLISAAAAGFLVFNFPPAKIFLGDMGSSTIGFLAAAFALWAARKGLFPLWISVLVFSPFICDATVTLLRRLVGGEKVWRPHRSHFYQRLVQIGWGHRRTVLREYVLMFLSAFSAMFLNQTTAVIQWCGIAAWILLYAILMLYITSLEKAHQEKLFRASQA